MKIKRRDALMQQLVPIIVTLPTGAIALIRIGVEVVDSNGGMCLAYLVSSQTFFMLSNGSYSTPDDGILAPNSFVVKGIAGNG